jgi:hypothetical protein
MASYPGIVHVPMTALPTDLSAASAALGARPANKS